VLVTDAEHSAAIPDMDATAERVTAIVGSKAAAGQVPVMGGFIGATPSGITTTLGRGGATTRRRSSAPVSTCDEIQIWTDVDGMLTADPRVVANPRSFRNCRSPRRRARLLRREGPAPSTILPAVARNIPVRILNSRRPDVRGR
jgi:aspartate kinase